MADTRMESRALILLAITLKWIEADAAGNLKRRR
jgi:hypothetical protein